LAPQSTSDSAPFLTWSMQVGAAQAPFTHTFEAQSEGTTQALAAPHGAQLPPQSTSVSWPFLIVSEQFEAAQLPLVHTFETQSPPPPHFLPFAQGEHMLPPQST